MEAVFSKILDIFENQLRFRKAARSVIGFKCYTAKIDLILSILEQVEMSSEQTELVVKRLESIASSEYNRRDSYCIKIRETIKVIRSN